MQLAEVLDIPENSKKSERINIFSPRKLPLKKLVSSIPKKNLKNYNLNNNIKLTKYFENKSSDHAVV